MEKQITLLEALTGVDFTIIHLDGRIVRIQSPAGQVIKPNQVMTCEGLGMPFHKTSYKHGNLFINFTIKFPDQVTDNQVAQVKTILKEQMKSQAELKQIDQVSEKVTLEKFEEHHKNTHAQGGTRGNDSEDEEDEEHGGQRVGCQAQ